MKPQAGAIPNIESNRSIPLLVVLMIAFFILMFLNFYQVGVRGEESRLYSEQASEYAYSHSVLQKMRRKLQRAMLKHLTSYFRLDVISRNVGRE